MKLTFLGTSDGVPSAERNCSCLMVEAGGKRYLFDCGAPAVNLLLQRALTPEDLTAVFTTHFHGDHVCGLFELMDLANWRFKKAKIAVYLTEQSGIDAFRAIIEATGTKCEESRNPFLLVTPGLFYDDRILRVTAIPTKHIPGRPSYAFLIEADGKRVVLTGDLSHFLEKEDFPAPAMDEENDLIISEMAHFTPEMAEPYFARCKTKRLLIHHVNRRETKLKGIEAYGDRFGFPVRAVVDGDCVTL